MEIRIIAEQTDVEELAKIAAGQFGDMVKAVVDVKKRVIAVAGELHADEEALLLKSGSSQEDLWGINIYPGIGGDAWIEFDSLINIRPSANNLSRDVVDSNERKKIVSIVNELIRR